MSAVGYRNREQFTTTQRKRFERKLLFLIASMLLSNVTMGIELYAGMCFNFADYDILSANNH